MHISDIPNNFKQWQVFEDDERIQGFMLMIDEYRNMNIDLDEEEESSAGKPS
jgi:hypothetical protein